MEGSYFQRCICKSLRSLGSLIISVSLNWTDTKEDFSNQPGPFPTGPVLLQYQQQTRAQTWSSKRTALRLILIIAFELYYLLL